MFSSYHTVSNRHESFGALGHKWAFLAARSVEGPRTRRPRARGVQCCGHDATHRSSRSSRGSGHASARLVRRPLESRRPARRRQGCQPRRAALGRAPGAARVRGHRGRLPRRDGGRRCARRAAARSRRRSRTWTPRRHSRAPPATCRRWSGRRACRTTLRRAVLDAYARLGDGPLVAVRSSATAEDTASTSFAGMNQTFTNVRGGEELVARIVDCWASLWGARVVAYRATHGLAAEPAIAVVVQEMVDSDASGVMFTADPATGDRDTIVIEAAFGLGEVVVGGQVEPDTYVLSKDGPRIVHVHVGTKTEKIVRGPDGHDQRLPVPPDEQARRVLDDDALLAAGRHGDATIEAPLRHARRTSSSPVTGERIWIVQSRPITTLARADGRGRGGGARHRARQRPGRRTRHRLRPGPDPAQPGRRRAPGRGRGARRDDDQPGLGAHHAAGGRAGDRRRRRDLPRRDRQARAAPAVRRRRPRTATTVLRDGEIVTVDGAKGVVLAGGTATTPDHDRRWPPSPAPRCAGAPAAPGAETTGTLLYVNLAIADHAEEVAAHAGRRRRAAACRVHDHRRAGRRAPEAPAGDRATRRVRRPDGRLGAADHPGLRAATGGLPGGRLPHQRVPRAAPGARTTSPSRPTR